MRTTNDMPIVEPPSLTALGLVPFQINAHYTDFHPPGFQGETRAERLQEFVAVNPGVRVLGLPEGTMVRVVGDEVALFGDGEAPVFATGEPVRRVRAGQDLGWLLSSESMQTG
jgi:dipeptidase E